MEDSTSNDAIEQPKAETAPAAVPAADRTAPKHSAASSSPFGVHWRPSDDWIRIATGVLAVAVLGVAIYLGIAVYSNWKIGDTQSPAARSVANLAAAVAANPNLALARVRLAEAMMANGQQADAIEQLQAALQIEEDNVAALTDLGLIAMDRGEWVKAEDYWKKLITILASGEMAQQDQRLADVYYYLGTTYVELKRYEDAVANLNESVKIKRDLSPVHYMLSAAYQRLDLLERQQQELEIVIAFDPEHAQANYDMGLLLLGRADTASAAEFFRVAQDNAPAGITDPQKQLDKLGSAADRLTSAQKLAATDPAAALIDARIAAAIDPSDIEALRLVAQLWEANNDPVKAQSTWQRIVDLLPGDVQATEAIKRLSANAK